MSHRSWLLLILVLLTVSACSKNLSITFEIPKEEIQKKLDQKFPIKPGGEEKEKPPMDLTVSDPVVLLEEGKNQIGLQVNIVAIPPAPPKNPPTMPHGPSNPPGPPGGGPNPHLKNPPPLPPAPSKTPPPPAPPKLRFTGTATLFASISYDPKGKAIHLSNPKITKLQIDQLPEAMTEPLSRMAEKALAQKLEEQPIPLENKTTLDQAVTTFMKSVTVKNGKVLVEIGW